MVDRVDDPALALFGRREADDHFRLDELSRIDRAREREGGNRNRDDSRLVSIAYRGISLVPSIFEDSRLA